MAFPNDSIRDIPKRPLSERFRERGLFGLAETPQDIAIQQAFQQFRQGVPGQPALEPRETIGITAPGEPPIMFPAREAVSGIQPQDIGALQKGLIGAGPQGIELAAKLGGKAAPSPFAKINPKDFTKKSVADFQRTEDYSKLINQKDPSGTGDKTFNREAKLRGEFTKLAGDFSKVRDSFARIESSAIDPSAAGDLSLIFNYMKMLDPGSVVRESEFATAANSAGVPDRIRKQWNRMLRGERLAPNTRADFVDRANRLWNRQELQHDKRITTYTALARRAGIDPRNVVIDIGLAKVPPVKTPKGLKVGRFIVEVE